METIVRAKEEEQTASADCKLGGLKHKIFKWLRRIVKWQPKFCNFEVKHKLLEGKLEFRGYYYMFDSYERELYSVGSQYQLHAALSTSAHTPE